MEQVELSDCLMRPEGSRQPALPGKRGDLSSVQSHHLNSELDMGCQTFFRLRRELHNGRGRERGDAHEPKQRAAPARAAHPVIDPFKNTLEPQGSSSLEPHSVSPGRTSPVAEYDPPGSDRPPRSAWTSGKGSK